MYNDISFTGNIDVIFKDKKSQFYRVYKSGKSLDFYRERKSGKRRPFHKSFL